MKRLLLVVSAALLAVGPIAASADARTQGHTERPPQTPPDAAPTAAPRTSPTPPPTPQPAPQPIELGRPQPLKVSLVAGGTVVGQITRWDVDGLDATVEGASRRLQWDDIAPTDLYRLRKRLLEQLPQSQRREASLELAAYLYSRADGETLGDRAFDDAKRWGAGADDRPQVRARGEERRQARNERLARADRARLAEGSPEASMFGNTSWPTLTPDEQVAAVAELRKQTVEMLAAAGRDATPVESKQCLVYSALGVTDAARRATEIEAFIEATLPRLGLAKEGLLWHGRLVVIVSEDRDQFALVEAAAFRMQPRADEIAITHYDGPKAFVHLLKQADEVGSRIAVSRAVALAMLHRYVSATRLPAWANEGFADWLVAAYRPTKSLDGALRRTGLTSVRTAGGFGHAAAIAYVPHTWPFRDAASRGEAYVLASYFAEHHGEAFLAFVKSAKAGEPWQGAFAQAFKAPLERMLDAAWDFHRVND